jgi:hypothetical protein
MLVLLVLVACGPAGRQASEPAAAPPSDAGVDAPSFPRCHGAVCYAADFADPQRKPTSAADPLAGASLDAPADPVPDEPEACTVVNYAEPWRIATGPVWRPRRAGDVVRSISADGSRREAGHWSPEAPR